MRRAIGIIVAGVLLGVVSPAGAATGGTYSSAPGAITTATCELDCAGLDLARAGSTIAITGTGMASVTKVVFAGGHSGKDDVTAPVISATDVAVSVLVPDGAVSGRLMVLNADGAPSLPSRQTIAVTTKSTPDTGAVHVRMTAAHVYYDGTNPATLRYFVDSASTETVTVTLVHGKNGSQVQAWPAAVLDPGTVGQVTWDGSSSTAHSGVASTGRYTFQVAVSGTGSSRALAGPAATSTFSFLPDVFPVEGKHTFNMGSGRFGASRSGHVHEGQDVMAKCGVPLVAARGGTVEKVAVDGNAGNYIVIDAAGTDIDMFYAHLRVPSPLKEGDQVLSGQRIGVVGRTGDATACHLHFEEWSAPGWYKGGHAFDPLPDLRTWERASRAAKR